MPPGVVSAPAEGGPPGVVSAPAEGGPPGVVSALAEGGRPGVGALCNRNVTFALEAASQVIDLRLQVVNLIKIFMESFGALAFMPGFGSFVRVGLHLFGDCLHQSCRQVDRHSPSSGTGNLRERTERRQVKRWQLGLALACPVRGLPFRARRVLTHARHAGPLQ